MSGEYDQKIESLHLKPKTRQEMADEYGISVNTFINKLKRAGIDLPKGLIFPATQKMIYYILGLPPNLETAKRHIY